MIQPIDTGLGFPLKYTLTSKQVEALITMSTVGYQYISYQCAGVITWLTNTSPNTEYAGLSVLIESQLSWGFSIYGSAIELKALGGQLWNKDQKAAYYPEVRDIPGPRHFTTA
jgi:hypothetical protein